MPGCRSSLSHALFPVALLLVLLVANLAHAQSLVVEAPPARLAQPGAYVTLVFTVRSAASATVALQARSAHAWTLLGPASTVTLQAGTPEPVAVTVAVPASAVAEVPDTVTLTAVGGGQEASASTDIEIARHFDLRLDTPSQVAVGGELRVTVRNQGNVGATAVVAVTRDQQQVGSQSLTIPPGKSAEASFPVGRVGRYQVTLSRDGTVLALRLVDTVVNGPPTPSTFSLSGTASASLDSNLAWQAAVSLQGPLSDYTNMSLMLQGDQPLESTLQLRSDRFGVDVGAAWTDPLGLPRMDGFGVAALWTPGAAALEGGVTSLGGGRFAGRLELGYRRAAQDLNLVGSLGMHAGNLTAAGRMSGTFDAGTASLAASFDGQSLSADYVMAARDSTGSYRVNASVANGFTKYGQFSVTGTYVSGTTSAFALGTVALGSEAAGRSQVGASIRLASFGGAGLDGNLAVGVPESHATVTYRPSSKAAVRPTASGGVVFRADGPGWGVAWDGQLEAGQAGGGPGWTGGVETRGQYFPATGEVRARIGAHALGDLPPFTLFGSGGWDMGTGTVSLSTGTIYSPGNWTLQANAGVSYTPGLPQPWNAQLQLQGRLAFDLTVPERVVQLAGGRRLGTLRVRVEADGEPLAGVGLAIGRYRLDTRADGTLTVRLPPGSVRVAVDLERLPANLQLTGSGSRTITLSDGATSEVAFVLKRTAAVRGRVLVDSDGNGTPDEPARGVIAGLVVEDALGQTHALSSAADGSFLARGLPAGTTTVSLTRTPPGALVVGSPKHVLKLAPGETASLDFLVQPAAARATVFGGAELRIREVQPEADAVPPGSAPLVHVTTVGAPDGVSIRAAGTVIHAVRLGPDEWRARVPVPAATAAAVEDLTVEAVKGDKSTSRSAELIVQAGAPMLRVAPLGVVVVGNAASLQVHVLFAARSVSAALAGQAAVALSERAPGDWQGELPIAAGTPPGLVTVTVTATRPSAPAARATALVRVARP